MFGGTNWGFAQQDPGDEDDGFPVCAACDRKHWQVNRDGLCTTCDSVVAAQARLGLTELEHYLHLYRRYQLWCLSRGVPA